MRTRRICWPEPDATCLEGGCIHCNDHPHRYVKQIKEWAATAGVLPNRCIGSEDAATAFARGLHHRFYGRVDTT